MGHKQISLLMSAYIIAKIPIFTIFAEKRTFFEVMVNKLCLLFLSSIYLDKRLVNMIYREFISTKFKFQNPLNPGKGV